MAVATGAAADGTADFLDPLAMAAAGRWELLSKRVVDGLLHGRHRSTHRGGMVEFAEFRDYSPGDEIRLIDWKASGRRDRPYVRRFEEEVALPAMLLVDASASMRFGMSTGSKFDFARAAAAALSRLAIRQRDKAGLIVFGGGGVDCVPPRGAVSHLAAVFAGLGRARAEGAGSVGVAAEQAVRRLGDRGLVVILSDLLGQRAGLGDALGRLRAAGHDAVVLQVLAPEELTLPFTDFSEFRDLEGAAEHVAVDPPSIRKAYVKRLRAFLDEAKTACGRHRCDHAVLSTGEPVAASLSAYLASRARALKRR